MLQELVYKSLTEFDFLESAKRATTSQTRASIPILNPTDQSYWETQAGSNCSQDESGCFVCNSGYSKCVHDVAVGKFDLCIADLWITPCRSAIAQFLPPVRFDMFYLVQAAKPRTEATPGAILGGHWNLYPAFRLVLSGRAPLRAGQLRAGQPEPSCGPSTQIYTRPAGLYWGSTVLWKFQQVRMAGRRLGLHLGHACADFYLHGDKGRLRTLLVKM